MFDFSGWEFLVVLVVAVFAFGPQDMPKLLYHLGRIVRRLHYMKFAFSQQFDDIMKNAEMQVRREKLASEQGTTPDRIADPTHVPHDEEMDDDIGMFEMMPDPHKKPEPAPIPAVIPPAALPAGAAVAEAVPAEKDKKDE